ncbi:hypothetical protein BYT27DRAFT_7102138, partial [Phlegmacium glaucopus]
GGTIKCNQSGCETQWVSTTLSSRIVLHYLPEMLVSPLIPRVGAPELGLHCLRGVF